MTTTDTDTKAPVNPKVVTAAITGGAAAPLAAWLVDLIPTSVIPSAIAPYLITAVVGAITFGAGWFKREFPKAVQFLDYVKDAAEPVVSAPAFADAADRALKSVEKLAAVKDDVARFVDATDKPLEVAATAVADVVKATETPEVTAPPAPVQPQPPQPPTA